MKYFFLLFSLLSFQVYCQIHIDTLDYSPLVSQNGDTILSGPFSHYKKGHNKVYDTTGLLIREGYYKYRYSFRYLFKVVNPKHIVCIGLWSHFEEGKLKRQVVFDKKGREIAVTTFYINGQIRKIKYRNKGKVPWQESRTYFENGELVDSKEDWNRFFKKDKTKE